MLNRLKPAAMLVALAATHLQPALACDGPGRAMSLRPSSSYASYARRPTSNPRPMYAATAVPAPRVVQQAIARPAPQPVIPAPVLVADVPDPAPAAPVSIASVRTAMQVEPQSLEAPAGAMLTLSQNDLGEQPGQVLLRLDSMLLRCEVLGWESTKVTFRMPEVLVEQALPGRLEVVLASGKSAVTYAVKVIAEPKVVVHDENSVAATAIRSPLVVNKYAAQNSGLGLPVPAPSLPALVASFPAVN